MSKLFILCVKKSPAHYPFSPVQNEYEKIHICRLPLLIDCEQYFGAD